jgi:hypothetical protein
VVTDLRAFGAPRSHAPQMAAFIPPDDSKFPRSRRPVLIVSIVHDVDAMIGASSERGG